VAPHSGFEIDTGWDDVVGTGVDVTIAFFFKAVHPIPSAESAKLCGPVGNLDQIRLLISGQPATFGQVSIWWSPQGSGNNTALLQDLLTPAFSDWVHVAVVVERSGSPGCQSAIVRWYVNGIAQIPQAPGGCWNNIQGSSLQTFRFGKKDDAHFMYDDWRVSLRAVPAAEILQWATADLAADAPFGDPCHPFGQPVLLWGSGGLPVPGNGGHALTVYGLPGSAVFLGIGLSDTSYGGGPLPIDLGALAPELAGCQLRAGPELMLSGTVSPAGTAVFPVPIPAIAALVGLDVYSQAVLYSGITGAWSSTNAWAMHLGN
jgi:hypothetical protein